MYDNNRITAERWEMEAHSCKSLTIYISGILKVDCYKLKIYTISPKIMTKITKLKILSNK